MKPYVWGLGGHWFVTTSRDEWIAYPGTNPLGYRTQREAFGAAMRALASVPS